MYAGNLSAEDRARVLKTLANASGIRLPQTRVPEGESLLPVGEESKRALQSQIATLPDLAEGLLALRSRIHEEEARDIKVPIQRVRMAPDRAGLFGVGQDPSKAIAYTDAGFSQVVSFVKPPGVKVGVGGTLLALPPKIRAEAFNFFAENSHRSAGDVVLRTFRHPESGNRRVIRAVTSERHSLTSGDDLAIASAVESCLPDGAKLRVTRSFDRTDLEMIWPAMDREIRVGDAALFALQIVNSETKGSTLRVEPKILRVLCYNFTTAYSEGGAEEIEIRHVGDLRTRLPGAISRALRVIEPFIRAFGDAYKVSLPGFAPTRGEVLERIGKAYFLPSATLDLAGQMWDLDGVKSAGDTLAGLSNALTRASQTVGMAQAAEVERVAGRIVVEGWGAIE